MKPPKATTDYEHGQMMGMLVIVSLLENAREANVPISHKVLDTIKNVASRDLAEYLGKPEEDVLLLVDQRLRSII